jgi:hypothetical protein
MFPKVHVTAVQLVAVHEVQFPFATVAQRVQAVLLLLMKEPALQLDLQLF